ncbi:MAG: argininosuccinate lyase, partial [Pseudomonadales bacterium]|nr:argininosuccinate lyase [Pseudomonadales bacterium]
MSDQEKSDKLWGGRFSEATDEFVERFTASVQFDKRLYQYDIEGSIAHARMLNKVGVLSDDEAEQIQSGLESIRQDIAAGDFDWSIELEDVHMNIEAALTAR